jgi:extracellular matrix regulatory protein A
MSLFMMNIGFGNFVNSNRVIAILDPDSAPMKRLREEARQAKKLVNATYGRRTRSVLITDSNQVILSALQPETIINRMTTFQKKENSNKE